MKKVSRMTVAAPHFLLFSEARRNRVARGPAGQWRFVLEALDGSDKIEVADEEPEAEGERLELLAVVRGLEALDQPSRVTLVTSSRYVSRGLRFGLTEWRENEWQWERFGQMTPIKNGDLWQRVDQALGFHKVDCRTWRFDQPHHDLEDVANPATASADVSAAASAAGLDSTPVARQAGAVLKEAEAAQAARSAQSATDVLSGDPQRSAVAEAELRSPALRGSQSLRRRQAALKRRAQTVTRDSASGLRDRCAAKILDWGRRCGFRFSLTAQ
jgi:ribonuclease HI